ncbi:MAG: carbamate kinase [Thermoplasmata archaeon]|nr:carbamate kinase [Thermoplasmata archaeon]
MKTAVVAIGGNALIAPGKKLTLENQMDRLRQTSKELVDLIQMGYDIVLTHGNGPQVGNILMQNELTRDEVPEMPLDALVAESQGLIGYMLQQSLTNELAKRGINKIAISVLTQVIVDEDDPAFNTPTKPVGMFYPREQAEKFTKEKGWVFGYEADQDGYRRLVPSPTPKKIVESRAMRRLIFGGEHQVELIIACGGGGIPVVKKDGKYVGVEAVVDKDLAACRLAMDIEEKLFIMLTDVDYVYLNYGTPQQTPIKKMTVADAKKHLKEGHFGKGSMAPKIVAATRFLEHKGEETIITSFAKLEDSIMKGDGTHITR